MDNGADEPSEKPDADGPTPATGGGRRQSDAGGDSDTTGAHDAGSTPPSGTRGDRGADANQGTGEGAGPGDTDIGAGAD